MQSCVYGSLQMHNAILESRMNFRRWSGTLVGRMVSSRKPMSAAEIRRMQLLRSQNFTIREIAKELGRSYTTIHSNLGRTFDSQKSQKNETQNSNQGFHSSLLINKQVPSQILQVTYAKDVEKSLCSSVVAKFVPSSTSQPPFQSIREPEVNIYAEEEKMTPRPDSSLLEEQSFTLDSVQENGVDTFHEPKVRHKKSKKIGSKRKLKKSSTIQATLDSLKTVTKAISAQHDEFSLFGEYMAMSLRTMPMRNALKCKEKLLSVIVNERLSLNSETS